MKSRLVCATIGVTLAAALFLLSCGPRAAAPTPTTVPTPSTPAPALPTPAPALTPAPTPAPAPSALLEKPKYGGTINFIQPTEIVSFDAGASTGGGGLWGFVNEQLMQLDRTRGPFGTGEFDYGAGFNSIETYGPQLAESWETPAVGVWIFKLRRGVHWALNPQSEASRLMNGREWNADDVVFNIRRTATTGWAAFLDAVMSRSATVEKTGPWEVTLNTPVGAILGWCYLAYGIGCTHCEFPPEVIQKYGNMLDWRNVVGTGPFMLTDYVAGSAITMQRNPNYWQREPVGPGKGDQLPYVDTVKLLIVPDISTRLAAMRTGRADWVTDVQWEDAASLIKTAPSLKSKGFISFTPLVIGLRMDKPELPYKDKKVRQALMMAIDYQSIKNDFYRGQAEVLTWPVVSTFKDVYVPMEKLPASVQALYQYNPARAKQLLAEAGYPNGFNAKMVVQAVATDMDMAQVVKAMWAKVGVNLEIQPRETSVFRAMGGARSHEEMRLQNVTANFPFWFHGINYRGTTGANPSRIDDPFGSDPGIETPYLKMQENLVINMPKAAQIFREELTPYLQGQAYVIPFPAPFVYTFWQPWVKGYMGEIGQGAQAAPHRWAGYMWVDQDMKEKMIGRR